MVVFCSEERMKLRDELKICSPGGLDTNIQVCKGERMSKIGAYDVILPFYVGILNMFSVHYVPDFQTTFSVAT